MTTVLNEEARQIHENGHLSDDDIARATGAAPSTARAWLAGTRRPTGQRAERLVELSALIERLAGVIDPDYIPVWLRKPIPALADEKPIDLIAAGRYREVAGVISSLERPGRQLARATDVDPRQSAGSGGVTSPSGAPCLPAKSSS